MKTLAILATAALVAVVALAGCGHSQPHPARTLSPAEQQVATQVETQAQHCLPKLQVTHPIVSLRTAVVPCMEAMVPVEDRPAAEQQMLTTARADKVWHHRNVKLWAGDMAAWAVAHHITVTATTS